MMVEVPGEKVTGGVETVAEEISAVMERSTDSIGGAVKERKRPLLRVDTGAVSDQAVPF